MSIMGWESFGGDQHAFRVADEFRVVPVGIIVISVIAKSEGLVLIPAHELPQLCCYSHTS